MKSRKSCPICANLGLSRKKLVAQPVHLEGYQNITFPVHPDPVSGMHCWHQKVKIEKAVDGDKYGDIFVDTNKSFEIYKEWLAMTRPAPGPGGLRRPLWMGRPLRPVDEAFYKK